MPSQEDIAKAKERRERRKLAREAAVEKAHAQEQDFSETVAKSKASPPRVAAPQKPSRERRAEERKEAERKADQQEREMKVDDTVPSPRAFLSRQPTLHELNKLARAQTKHFKSGARVVAKAAGRAAYNAAMSGEAPHLQPSKHQRMFNAERDMRNAKSEQKTDE